MENLLSLLLWFWQQYNSSMVKRIASLNLNLYLKVYWLWYAIRCKFCRNLPCFNGTHCSNFKLVIWSANKCYKSTMPKQLKLSTTCLKPYGQCVSWLRMSLYYLIYRQWIEMPTKRCSDMVSAITIWLWYIMYDEVFQKQETFRMLLQGWILIIQYAEWM